MSASQIPAKVYMFPDNDNVITVRLFDKGTNTYFDAGAAVTATLLDYQQNQILQIVLTLVVGSTTGDFTGKMPLATVALQTGATLFIEASEGSAHNTWPIPCEVTNDVTKMQ